MAPLPPPHHNSFSRDEDLLQRFCVEHFSTRFRLTPLFFLNFFTMSVFFVFSFYLSLLVNVYLVSHKINTEPDQLSIFIYKRHQKFFQFFAQRVAFGIVLSFERL